jgi:glycosyltransferase involved in cell wall biosynthesis
MKIWIVNPYGNLPHEGWTPYRSVWLGRALAARGHEVTWWISEFEHRKKVRREVPGGKVDVAPGFEIRLVPARPYGGNISVGRIRYERSYAQAFARMTAGLRADLAVHVDPAVFFWDLTVPALRAAGAKLVIDVLDLWPELFAIALPKPVRWTAPAVLGPLYAWRRRFYRQADGFLAASADYLAIAQRAAPRTPGRTIYIGAQAGLPAPTPAAASGLPAKRPGETWVVYSGTFGYNYDLASIVEVAKRLHRASVPVRFVLVGEGPLEGYIAAEQTSGGLDTLTCIGRVAPEALRAIYAQCDLALCTYVGQSTVSMPLKAYDYIRAGLPMLCSLTGEIRGLVERRELGIGYASENVAAVEAAVLRLAREPETRARMRANNLALAAEFDSENQHRQAAAFLETI